jgi:hypothetical protein
LLLWFVARLGLLRMQNELLHAPVQDFSREQHVLGGTRELMNPAELLEPFADYSSPISPRSCLTEDSECTRMTG